MLYSQSNIRAFLLFLTFSKSVSTNMNTTRISNVSSISSTEPLDVIELLKAIFNLTAMRTEKDQPTENNLHILHRVKRQQQGESKYTQASKMGEVKMIRLFAQMLANPFSSAYIGGAHPFHHEVPKTIVILFKQKFMDFLFPRIGDRW